MMETRRLDEHSINELQQICQLEKTLYGSDHALASIDFFGQLTDKRLGSMGIIIASMDSSRVAGYILGIKGHEDIACFIANLVHPDYRGQGWGYTLKKDLAAAFKREGYRYGIATVSPGNQANVPLNLNKLKWKVTGWVPDKYGPKENRFYIEGDLNFPENPGQADALTGEPAHPREAHNAGNAFYTPLQQDYDFSFINFDRFQGTEVVKYEGTQHLKFTPK